MSDTLWRSADLRLVGGARAVSVLGDEIAMVALLMRLHDQGLGPFAITGLLIAFAVPTVAVAGLAGHLVDRFDSRLLTVGSSLWQAAACLALVLAPETGPLGVGVIYALVALLQVGNAVALPTWQALVPLIVGDERLGRAMGDLQGLSTLVAVAGPAIGGLLMGGPGFAWAMTINAISFAVLAVAAGFVKTRRRPGVVPDSGPADSGPADRGASGRARGGLAILRADRLLWPLITGLLALIVVVEGSSVAEVFMVRDTLHSTSSIFGYVQAMLAYGLVGGSLLAGALADETARLKSVLLGLGGLSLALLAASVMPDVVLLALCFVGLGVSMAVVNAGVQTLVLHRTPPDQRGRVIATFMGLARSGSVIALGLGGLSTSLLSPRWVFAAAGAAALVSAGVTAARTAHFWRVRAQLR